jgi:hypothetical protein
VKFTPRNITVYLFFKLPSAFWCGVRVERIAADECITRVRHRWFNQNPFQSMYFAVQAMAAELSTGALMMRLIADSGQRVSMLVVGNEARFGKRARGLLHFACNDGPLARQALERAIATGEGQTVWMTSTGVNEQGEQVSQFRIEWSLKLSR